MRSKLISFEEAFKILELPEYLNGLERSHWISIMKSDREKRPILIETCRCLQNVYEEICAARFALINSCKLNYPEFIASDENRDSHLWIQSQFANNAILWYNATFDILLQVLWMYYKLYEHLKKPLKFSNQNMDLMLAKCKLDKFKESIIGKEQYALLVEFTIKYKPTIAEWANTLKHRRMIEYKELQKGKYNRCYITSYSDTNTFNDIKEGNLVEYDSSETLIVYSLSEVINKLFEYHKDICKLARTVFDNIKV